MALPSDNGKDMQSHAWLKDLRELDLSDGPVFGPKAAMLGHLARHGHVVPDGFALSAECFDQFLSRNGFPYVPDDYLACSAEIRELLRGGAPGRELEDALEACVHQLRGRFPAEPIIVRTSALCEDSADASMAGVFASSEPAGSLDEVKRAVLSCWLSLFSDSAINAWATGRSSAGPLRAGLILQRYVAGNVSGVTFTADTKEMDPGIVVISAVAGPCSILTSGSGSPTTYACDKGGRRPVATAGAAATGGLAAPLVEPWLSRVLASAIEIERLAGCPQDIEWTIADQLYVLQSRPITGLRVRTAPAQWATLLEAAPAAGLTWTLRSDTCLPPLVGELVVINSIAAGHCAYDRGMVWDSQTGMVLNGYFYEAPRPIPDSKQRLDDYMATLSALFDQGAGEYDRHIEPELARLVAAMTGRYVDRPLSRMELGRYLQDALDYLRRSAGMHWRATTSEWYLGYFFRQRIGRLFDELGAQDLVDMVYGRSWMVAEREELYAIAAFVQGSLELARLFSEHHHDAILEARLRRSRHPAARSLREQLTEYGRRYGWFHDRNLEDGSLCAPGTLPLQVCISRLRRYLHVNMDEYRANLATVAANAGRLRELGRARCATEEERLVFDRALAAGEKAFLAGDDHASLICSRKYVFASDALRRVGALLAAEKTLDSPDDIHYLYLAEVEAFLEHGGSAHELVRRRRAEHREHCRLFPPGTIGAQQSLAPTDPAPAGSDDRPPSSPGSSPPHAPIKGQSGTRKDARGRLHVGWPKSLPDHDVILLLDHGHEGDLATVLGCTRGLVLKMGTPASHMGIIARELGIPALYGVGDKADFLRTGDEVQIKGDTGELVVLAAGARPQPVQS